MFKVAGGNIVDKIPSWRDDFTEYKYNIIDNLDYEYYYAGLVYYIDKENEQEYYRTTPTYLDERKIDYYNGYEIDDDGNSVVLDRDYVLNDSANECNEDIYIKRTNKFHYFILHDDLSIYQCDECGVDFLTYKDHYEEVKTRNNYKEYGNMDLCLTCKSKKVKRNRAIGFKKAMDTMSKNETVKTSKQQKYIAQLLNGKLNQVICGYFADILLDNKIVVEYDGSGHWLKERYQGKTKEQIDKEDKIRDKIMIKEGYKIIRIVSKNDLLPFDEEIIGIMNDAVKSFSIGSSFYRIEINDQNFNKDTLRKITNNDVLEVITSGQR